MISRSVKPLEILRKNTSILLLGPRGTGKTALLKSLKLEGLHLVEVDLLQGNQYSRYLQNPGILGRELREMQSRSQHNIIVTIDEVQKLPALLDEAHSLIEEFKGEISFLFSGSSARKLKRGGANLLAGRAISRYLFPLSNREIDLDLNRALLRGTLPAIYLADDEIWIDKLSSYMSTYLREEIKEEALVRGIDRFARFLDFSGQLNGEPVNFSKLGKQLGIAGKTAAEYFSILADTLLIHEIRGWSHSVKKQLLHASKFYFFDTGVLNAINGYLRVELKESGYIYGKLFESFIVSQLIASNEYANLGLRFFYWRDKNGQEVDLIIARNVSEPLLAVEIKSSSTPKATDCPGFASFADDYPKVEKVCICTTTRSYSDAGVRFIPWQDALNDLEDLLK